MTFDLQKARKLDESLYDEPGHDEGGNPCPIREEIIKMFPVALDEIERLQEIQTEGPHAISIGGKTFLSIDVDEGRLKQLADQAKRIAELEAEAQELHDRKEQFAIALARANRLASKQRAALKKLARKVRGRGKALVEHEATIYANRLRIERLEYHLEREPTDLNNAYATNKFLMSQITRKHEALKKIGKANRNLRKALVEERAKDDAKLPELCDIVRDELMCPALEGDCEHWEGCPRKDELRQKSREQLRQEGKL